MLRDRGVVTHAATIIMLLAAFLTVRDAVEGDSAIYFTFAKRFFERPFSYQPSAVSFGATSPLHVVILAVAYVLAGPAWILASKILSFGMLALAVVLLAKGAGGMRVAQLHITLLTVANVTLLVSTSRLFESGLSYVAVAALYFAMRRGQSRLATAIAGSLHLVRPELILLTGYAFLHFLVKSSCRRSYMLRAGLSFLPVLAYYIYMGLSTGSIVPTSVYGRLITAREAQLPWSEAFIASYVPLLLSPANFVYLAGFLAVLGLFLGGHARRFWLELVFLVLLVVPFVLFPALSYTARYLLPATAILTVIAARGVELLRVRARLTLATILFALMVLAVSPTAAATPAYDLDRLLLFDMSRQLNPVVGPTDHVLLYEIQGQFDLNAPGVSLDGIVGADALPFLVRQQTFGDFVRTRKLAYIVTHNALVYRPIFRGTPLVDLYRHDLSSGVGDRVEVGGILLEKVITNPSFADPARYRQLAWPDLNDGEPSARVYAEPGSPWDGHWLTWNSVYRVISSSASGTPP
jgi:hypothetical protein